jgi:outer membrane protein assembly factor BamA
MRLLLLLFLLSSLPFTTAAQAPATAKLREVHTNGQKYLTEDQIASLTGLTPGTQVGKQDLQDAADALVRTGLFAKVNYKFDTKGDAVTVTFLIEENPRLEVSYDNFPWYTDTELNDAIHKKLPFFDGHLPEAGAIVDAATAALQGFVAQRDPNAQVTHEVIASPLIDASLQQFTLQGPAPLIASLQFSDAKLAENPAVRAHLSEVLNHTYSRLTIDVFLAEQIRPIYLQQGYLRAKIGPPEVHLPSDAAGKLPDQIPVFVPCNPGDVYKWKGVDWAGNSALSTITLSNNIGLKPGDIANGQTVEGGWDRIREDYGHIGYLDVKLTPQAVYDDVAHTISYRVTVDEGKAYRYGSMTVTGMSVAGERLIRDSFPLKEGEVFDKKQFEDLLVRLESKRATVFKDLPVHYDTVGHFLQTDADKGTVEVLLDFK